jgi:signal transduction histidine kinase/CheY-like chemotaxis protein
MIAGLVLLLSMGAELVRSHITQQAWVDQAMRNSLRRAAAACAQTVDPAVHVTLKDPSQEGSPAYNEACLKLEKAKKAEEDPDYFAFVYTCILRDGKVYFILDPTAAGDSDGDGVDDKSHLMQEYPEASQELIRTLQTGKPSIMAEPQKDRWGTFLSAYAPVNDAGERTVAAVGVDMKLSQYEGNLRAITMSSLVSGAGAFVLSLLAGIAVWAYEKRHRKTILALLKTTAIAQAADRAKSRFLATMSHEIRTPMNGVMGMTELMRLTPLTDVQRDYLDTIQVSGENLLMIIDDILDFSRMETGSVDLESAPVGVEEMLKEVGRQIQPQAAEKSLELQINMEAGTSARVVTDAARLRQVLMNLAGNAIKFTTHGRVRLQASPDSLTDGRPGVRFSVTDTGIGIKPEPLKRLFKPFSQADSSTTREYGGTGLGLVICERLCRAMGGEIHVESRAGHGSTFWFTVPAEIVSEETTTDSSPGKREGEPAGETPAEAPRAVVICEDRLLRTLLVRLLEKTGCQVESVETVEAALECVSRNPALLVLLDMELVSEDRAGFGGFVARQLPTRARLAVVGGELSAEDKALLRTAGVIGMLPRIPKVAELAALVKKKDAV